MILDLKNLTKDPVQKKILCNEMHTQPHAAPRVTVILINALPTILNFMLSSN